MILLFLLLPFVVQISGTSLADLKKGIKDGSIYLKGTNLGGWLVAEHWMTTASPAWNGVPGDVANKGEYVTMKHLGKERGDAQFKAHRDGFYSEQDFAEIAAAGLNTLRIPIGYWIVGFDKSGGGDPNGWQTYAPGALDYLDRAIRDWAPKHNLLVIVNMHAAKGSQNGNDHSAPANPGQKYWGSYQENVNNTLDVVEFIARRYKDEASFLGIGLLNEPMEGDKIDVLKQYYYDAYGRIRNDVGTDCLLTISPLLWQQGPGDGGWENFMIGNGFYNLRHEWHPYYAFEPFPGKSYDYVMEAVRNYKRQVQSWKGNWLFFGEWSMAAATGMNDWQMKEFGKAQLDNYYAGKGFAFWSWKQYGDDGSNSNGWSFRSMLRHGFLPNPL